MSRTTKGLLALAAAMIAACVLYAMGAIPYRVYVVHTGSMGKAIPPGSAVLVRTGQYRVGQVITVIVNGQPVTHQLLGINPDGTINTQGKANPSPDPQHPPKGNIIGGVVATQRGLGWVLYFIGVSPTGALSIMLLGSAPWQSNRFAKTFAQQQAS